MSGPRTLFGRIALIVGTGLLLGHLLTIALVWRERSEQGLAMMSAYVGRDVAAAVALLDRLPAAERGDWLPKLARPQYRYSVDAPALADAPAIDGTAQALGRAIVAALGRERVGAWHGSADELALPLRLADGTPLILRLMPMRATISASTIALLALQLLLLLAATWWAVRLAVRPLARLSDAVQRLEPADIARGIEALDEGGPRELAGAARAFNAMQRRIAAHLDERQRMLAAIAHDLQTPLTRARLRSEAVADDGLRDKLQSDLAAMQGLVEEGLAYARTAQARQEAPQAVDLAALLDGIACDAHDAGHAVSLQLPPDLAPVRTRVQALRRIVGNLLDNAIKFSSGAPVELRVERIEGRLRIAVLDRGPGIADGELAAVLQPFYRVESSRNRATGGTGLGLAIASELAAALPGRLELRGRVGGGLEARLTLD